MPRSLGSLFDAALRRALIERGLARPPRRHRRAVSSARRRIPLSPPPLAPTFVFRAEDFDPTDLVTDYTPTPGACMADMEDGEQPFGPPSPSYASDDLLHDPADQLSPALAA